MGVYLEKYQTNFYKALDFLNCTNEYCVPWKFKSFEIKSVNLVKLLEPVFGPLVQLPNNKSKAKGVQKQRKEMSKRITKTICSCYRAIIDS